MPIQPFRHGLAKTLWALALGAMCVLGLALLLAPTAFAKPHATITVNTTADNGPGNCNTTCTLRDAIASATDGDTIGFSVTGIGTITLDSAKGPIIIYKNLTIAGPGASQLAISANHAGRVFTTGSADLTLSGLTIRDGNMTGGGLGGAIENGGTLTVTNSTISGNQDECDTEGSSGGGIANMGTLTVINSTFSNNSNSGGINCVGGGIWNNDTLMVINSTFSGNSSAGSGGGIGNYGTLTVINSTFSGNSATTGGGAIFNASGNTATIQNSILANSVSGGNCSGTITNGGNNIDNVTSCNFGSANGSLSSTDPQLGTLTGSPAYFPLNYNSPAIDGVTNNAPNNCPSADQRGQNRDDLACDIGAYEMVMTDRNNTTLIPGATMRTFGPPRAGIQVTSGSTNAVTVTKSANWTTQPGNAIKAWWELTLTSASGWTANVELCYLDATELNGLVAANLHLWRYSGSAWSDMGRASASGNCVQVNDVTAFSRWTMATGDPGNIPTSVTLSNFNAHAPTFDLGAWFRKMLGW